MCVSVFLRIHICTCVFLSVYAYDYNMCGRGVYEVYEVYGDCLCVFVYAYDYNTCLCPCMRKIIIRVSPSMYAYDYNTCVCVCA